MTHPTGTCSDVDIDLESEEHSVSAQEDVDGEVIDDVVNDSEDSDDVDSHATRKLVAAVALPPQLVP
ncbi:hypothetical protein ACS0TY_021843 [Phlomoides rotata]